MIMVREALVKAIHIRMGGKKGKGLIVGKEGEPFSYAGEIDFVSPVPVGLGDILTADIVDGAARVKGIVKSHSGGK